MGLLKSLFAKQLVGLDIGTSGIKAVEIHGKDSPRLVAYQRVALPWDAISTEGEIKDRAVVVNALKKIFDKKIFSSKLVAVGAAGNAIITKKITVNKMSEEELREQLYWEAEQYIPFNINEVNLDFAIIGNSNQTAPNGGPMMDALLVAAKRDYVSAITSIVEEAGLEPSIVDSQAFALGNAFEFNYGHVVDMSPGGSTNVILDFGAGSTKVSVVEGDKTTFTRELRQCGIACTQMLSERLGVSIEEAERLKILEGDTEAVDAIVTEYVQGTVDEIARTLDFAVGAEHAIQGVYLCGGASRTYGLIDALEDKLPAPIAPLNPVQNIAGSGKKMNAQAIREMAYLGAVAVGLSLRTTGDTR